MIHLDGTSEESRAFGLARVAAIVDWHLQTLRARVINRGVARYNHGRDNKSLNRSGVRLLCIRETRMLI